jgi:hypothetical protein
MILGKKDRIGFRCFVKALFLMLKENEGIIVKDNDKTLKVVYKGRHEDGEMLMHVDTADGVPERYRHEGQFLWINDDKKLEEQEKTNESV